MEAKRVGRRIKSYRKLKRYTQQQFADQLHISVGLLSAVERGAKEAPDELLQKIVATLQIDKQELIDADGHDDKG
ncbi:helix-turn-helix domain-containing protein [Virgibacillus halophilus]|uniref:Helix-turn-helix transcriptional regulator n=1 Tax=Tigheibacillus halophilus TaxID=361280 RepID=A0ABU5C733_9BACI|nr:helix-turn-helix transcriptional regulator [Virgibacillus halophilus]